MKNFLIRYVKVNSRWFLEENTSYEGAFHSLQEILYAGTSQYQQIEIIITGSYGKSLVLDGKLQSTEADEFIYHEALVHPAMVALEDPQSVLIAGGGEGATARETLRYKSINRVDIVDLDNEVVEVSKVHLTKWHQGSFDNARVKVFYEDAREYIENNAVCYDLIIADLPEPYEHSPAVLLYTKEFFLSISKRLSPQGIFVTQATSASVNNLKTFTAIVSTLSKVFSIVRPYVVNVPSFHSPWGFVMASKETDPLLLSKEVIRERISPFNRHLLFYDEYLHHSLFSLPKYLKEGISRENTIITDASPVSFY